MSKITLSIVGVFISLTLTFYYSSDTKAATCELSNATWNLTSAVIGQEVKASVRGVGDCQGRLIVFRIYEEDPISNDLITVIEGRFPTPSNGIAQAGYRFTPDDYQKGGNESGSETMIFYAAIGHQAPASQWLKSNSPLTLREPAETGTCQLATARWSAPFTATPIEGSPMKMVVTGLGCANADVRFTIRDDSVGTSTPPRRGEEAGSATAKFNSNGTQAEGTWKVIDRGNVAVDSGNYVYFFEATVNTTKLRSDNLEIPVRSGTGCINCNSILGIAPDVCECADSSRIPRGSFSNCRTVCSDHIGDAHGGTGPIGPPASTSVPGPIGREVTFNFEIKNPLKINSFLEFITTITVWLTNIAIPIAVILIVYAGVLFLTAGAVPANVSRARSILTYVVIGLSIILIGRGFITLIESVLNLGGSPTTTSPTPSGSPTGTPNPSVSGSPNVSPSSSPGGIGAACLRQDDCREPFHCGSRNICQRSDGNLRGEPCFGNPNCASGLSCLGADVDNKKLGTCQ